MHSNFGPETIARALYEVNANLQDGFHIAAKKTDKYGKITTFTDAGDGNGNIKINDGDYESIFFSEGAPYPSSDFVFGDMFKVIGLLASGNVDSISILNEDSLVITYTWDRELNSIACDFDSLGV